MTDRGTHSQEMDKEVQHSKSQAVALSLRGIGERKLHRSEDRLSDEQIALFARMRDQGAKICVTGVLGQAPNAPEDLGTFLSARVARGRELTPSRQAEFQKMPRLARTTALRSMVGGHFAWVSDHADGLHHFYGLSERGLAVLAQEMKAKRQAVSRPAPPTE